MIEVDSRPHYLIESYNSIKGLLAAFGPEELQVLRERALKSFEIQGLPTTADEEFKYVSLKAIDEGRFAPAYGATVNRHQSETAVMGHIDAITVVFVNGQYAPELSNTHALPANVFVGSLADGFLTHREQIDAHLSKIATLEGRLGSTNDDRFVNLNTAFLSEGAFLYVGKGVDLNQPVHFRFVSEANHGPFMAHPRVLIVLEESSSAKVIESYVGLSGTYATNTVTEIYLGEDALMEHTRAQFETGSSVHIANIATHQEASSVFTSNNINFGSHIARVDLNVYLNGEHTETWLNGVNVATGHQVVDNHTRIDHAKPNCNSFEVYKSILDDKAIGIFNGKIFVYEDAQKTDAKQTNQGILLSKEATFNTKPQLEIFADDVKCTHGATVGQLQEDALFYFRARGVPKLQAQALLVYAFAAEALDKITIAQVKDALESQLYKKLNVSETIPDPTTA